MSHPHPTRRSDQEATHFVQTLVAGMYLLLEPYWEREPTLTMRALMEASGAYALRLKELDTEHEPWLLDLVAKLRVLVERPAARVQ